MASSFDDALASLELIESTYRGIEVLAALPNQEYDASGALVDSIQLTFQIIGRPGPLTVSVPYDQYWQDTAAFAMEAKAFEVELIYEGAANLQGVPTVDLTQLISPALDPNAPIPLPVAP